MVGYRRTCRRSYNSRLSLFTVFAFRTLNIARKSFFEWPAWDEYPVMAMKDFTKHSSAWFYFPISHPVGLGQCERSKHISETIHHFVVRVYFARNVCYRFTLLHKDYGCLQDSGTHLTGFVFYQNINKLSTQFELGIVQCTNKPAYSLTDLLRRQLI